MLRSVLRPRSLVRLCSTIAAPKPAVVRLPGVVVGEVLQVAGHPQAERLHVCQVAVGPEVDPVQIICGAPNVRAGLKVPVATIGSRLTLRVPNPEDATALVEKVLKIKKSKLRGEVSQGMICSEEELGLAESSNGIMELDLDATVGTAIADYLAARNL